MSTAQGIQDTRLNVLVKDGLQYQVLPFMTDLPSVLLQIGESKCLLTYREWAKDGDQSTKYIPMQEARFEPFVKAWKRIRGRLLSIGDFNVEYWRLDTQQHRNVQGMKQMILDEIVPRGFVQCVQEDTRVQGSQKSCLDHIYSNQGQFIAKLWNKNVIGYDHNMIGVRLRLKSPVSSLLACSSPRWETMCLVAKLILALKTQTNTDKSAVF